jgi:hypothetical protein
LWNDNIKRQYIRINFIIKTIKLNFLFYIQSHNCIQVLCTELDIVKNELQKYKNDVDFYKTEVRTLQVNKKQKNISSKNKKISSGIYSSYSS